MYEILLKPILKVLVSFVGCRAVLAAFLVARRQQLESDFANEERIQIR